MCVFEREVCL